MCICGGVEILVIATIAAACKRCGKKDERLIHLNLSSNECGQSSSKVPDWDGTVVQTKPKVPVEEAVTSTVPSTSPKKPCVHSQWDWNANSYGWLQKHCVDCWQWLGGVLKGKEAIAKAEEYRKEYGHIPNNHCIEYLQEKESKDNRLCEYCSDGTLDRECGDCHNTIIRCGSPQAGDTAFFCIDCDHDGVPGAGRKLLPGEKSWKEKSVLRKLERHDSTPTKVNHKYTFAQDDCRANAGPSSEGPHCGCPICCGCGKEME